MRSKANFLNYLITGKKYLKININMLRLFILVTNWSLCLKYLKNLIFNFAIFLCGLAWLAQVNKISLFLYYFDNFKIINLKIILFKLLSLIYATECCIRNIRIVKLQYNINLSATLQRSDNLSSTS